jgi:hypothetical protein
MTRAVAETSSSRDITSLALVVAGIAGLVVPPSLPGPGLTEAERWLSASSLPMLLIAFFMILLALSVGDLAQRRLTLFGMLLINVAGYLSGRYGVDGAGVGFTLVLTGPLLLIAAKRRFAERRLRSLES